MNLETAAGRRVIRCYLAGFTLSMVGTGLWLPLNAVYLNQDRDLTPGLVGMYYVVLSAASITSNLVNGPLADRIGPFRPFVTAGLAQAAGMVLLAAAPSTPFLFLAAAVCGAGNGGFFACQTAVLTRVFGIGNLSTVYGRQYQIMNLAIGVGALAVGTMAQALGHQAFVIGFCLNGLSYALHVLNVVGPVRRLARRTTPDQPAAASGRAPVWDRFKPYRDLSFLPVIALQLCITIFAVAQFEAVVPVVLARSADLPLWGITAFEAANCLGVVLLQPWATRYVNRAGPEAGLRAALMCWLVLPLPGVCAAVADGFALRLALLLAVAFSAGEVFVAPSLQPLAAARAPDGRLATYTASVSLANALGLMLGPALLLPVFGSLGHGGYWAALGGGVLATTAIHRAILRTPDTHDVAAA
ncbi:MFS transporter [Streptomyces sp. SAS_275]|uniref:MFS transporter n=1 Tax=Streptomyces sp. SAS_275 TaxID=3412746 RepID=UPI00403C3371